MIFKSSLVEEDGHGVLYGNGINVFEGISDSITHIVVWTFE